MCRYSVMWRGVYTCACLYIYVYGLYHQTDINLSLVQPQFVSYMYIIIIVYITMYNDAN